MKRVLAAASAALIAAVLLAGCGGGGGAATPSGPPLTKAEYRTKVSETVTSVRARYGNLSIDPTKISPGELAKVEQALRELADRLEQVNAPAEVNRLHTDFVAALRSFADELPDLSSKIRKDPAAGLGVLLDSKSIQTLLRVSQELGRRGYEIELGSA